MKRRRAKSGKRGINKKSVGREDLFKSEEQREKKGKRRKEKVEEEMTLQPAEPRAVYVQCSDLYPSLPLL